MTIPEVRDRLYELADEHAGSALGAELHSLADNLWRRRSSRSRTAGERVESRPMTPQLAAWIRGYAERNPDETELAIGIHFGVNQGRVSEALYGKRT